jgi:1-acyl-sn-glycerol-3-phosphate acyltransferase
MELPKLSPLTRVLKAAILWFYRRQGWTEVNANPDLRKCVVIAVPHTSNWDFVYFIGAAAALDLPLSFAGKKQMFRWPFGRAMHEMGGVPVDRSRSTNFVDAMIAEFAKRDVFMLTIAPEGTRGMAKQWKTGFYYIALGAKVPLVIGLMDYAKKTVGLAGAIWPTGDYAADMDKAMEIYRTCTPKNPGQLTLDIGGPGGSTPTFTGG